MPKGFAPAVFVSSTCYDLSQIRADLKEFIQTHGFEPVLSEFNSFPMNPNYDTIRNCLEVIKNHADIFVLIVGGRYGEPVREGKSVTNLEYLEAKAKGIPIYVFVSKAILNILPVWKSNKNGDYATVVDSPRLFEFVESLKDKAEHWVYAFETAQDITATLRTQLAYLFMDSLDIRRRIRNVALDQEFQNLSPKGLELLIQKPIGWEYSLFAQALRDGIRSFQDQRYDLKYSVKFGNGIGIENLAELSTWLSNHMNNISNTTTSLTNLINSALPVAFGPPGVAGNPKEIVYVANRVSQAYKRMIDWTLEFRRINVEQDFERLIELASSMAMNMITEIEEFTERIDNEIDAALSNLTDSSEARVIKLTLTLTVPDMTALYDELERVKLKYSV